MKKKIKVENFGLKPLVFKLKEDREIKKTVEKKRKTEGKVTLSLITDKITETKLKAPSIVSINKARNKEGHILEKFGQLPVSICDTCPYKRHCPYFSKNKVCQFITSYFEAPRLIHKFIPYIIKYINDKIWHSSVLTDKQTGYDSLDLMFAVYSFVKVIKDQRAKYKVLSYTGKYKTENNRRKVKYKHDTAREEQEAKKRKEILGMIYTNHDYLEK